MSRRAYLFDSEIPEILYVVDEVWVIISVLLAILGRSQQNQTTSHLGQLSEKLTSIPRVDPSKKIRQPLFWINSLELLSIPGVDPRKIPGSTPSLAHWNI